MKGDTLKGEKLKAIYFKVPESLALDFNAWLKSKGYKRFEDPFLEFMRAKVVEWRR